MIAPFKLHQDNGRFEMPDREWLENQFLTLGKSQRRIAQEVGCNRWTVRAWTKYHNLQKPNFHPLRVNPGRDWLYHNYIDLNKTVCELATELGCSTQPVMTRLKEYGITKPKARLALNHSEKMSGDKNPAWVDGSSQGHQVNKLRRSGLPEVCQWCGTEDNIQVHHIDHDRANHDLGNMTWLCGTCNRLEAHLRALKQSGRAKVLMEKNRISIEFVLGAKPT